MGAEALEKGAEVIITRNLGVKPDEKVLIITDSKRMKIAEALRKVSEKYAKETEIIKIKETKHSGEEPPDYVADAMKNADAILIPTTKSLSHTQARIQACEQGARVGSMPGITEEMFKTGLTADCSEIADNCEKLKQNLLGSDKIRVTAPNGTDITFSVKGRNWFVDDGVLTKPGKFGSLPAGEIYIAPLEETANGNVFTTFHRLYGKEVELIFKNGKITETSDSEFDEILNQIGECSRNLAEFGIGLNPKAIFVKTILQDEKLLETIHLAIGTSVSFGGKIKCSTHQDGLIFNPTVEIDGKLIMDKGNLLML